MDFDNILKELKSELLALLNNKFTNLSKESKKDIDAFLKQSEEKLKRWTFLLAQGELTQEDFEWLVKSQKDLMLFQALHTAGVSKIKLGHLKNSIVNTIVSTIIKLVVV